MPKHHNQLLIVANYPCIRYPMKLRVVSSRNEIQNLNPNERMIHVGFQANNSDYLNLIQKCPKSRIIQVPFTYYSSLSQSILMFMDIQGIKMLEGDIWDCEEHQTDYFSVDDSIVEEIRSLSKRGASSEEIEDQIQRKIKIAPDLINYISKNEIYA